MHILSCSAKAELALATNRGATLGVNPPTDVRFVTGIRSIELLGPVTLACNLPVEERDSPLVVRR